MKKSSINHSERSHALLSASSTTRWLNCTPSARLEDLEPDTSSVYADEGTAAHELAEFKLRGAVRAVVHGDFTPAELKSRMAQEKLLKKNKHYLANPTEMDEATDLYVKTVIDIFKLALEEDPCAEIHIERKLDLTAYAPESYGTGDTVITSLRTIWVLDYKHGQGIKVSAKDNDQMSMYGLGAVKAFGFMNAFEKAVLVIVQPRMNNVSFFERKIPELLHWGETVVKPAALIAFNGGGEQKPGNWCHFCKVKNKCKALHTEATALAVHAFADAPAMTMSDSEILEVFSLADRLTKWLDSMKKSVLTEARNGKKWKGYKLVEGKSNRLLNAGAATKILLEAGFKREVLYKESLIGIGDLEKLLGKPKFESMLSSAITKPPGAPTLVPEDDKRPALQSTEDKFNDGFTDEEVDI